MVSLNNSMEGNFNCLLNLFSQQADLDKQFNTKFTERDDAYKKLGIVGKFVSHFSYSLVDPEMATCDKEIKSLLRKYESCNSKIFDGIEILEKQLTKTIRKIADKTFNGNKSSSDKLLIEFEEAYKKYNQLIAVCNGRHMQDTDQVAEDRGRLLDARAHLVYNLLQKGIMPRESWVNEQEELEEVLLEVITRSTREKSGFYKIRFPNELLFAICERGQSDLFQFICDHVSSEALLEAFTDNGWEGVDRNPISAAIRHGHTSIVEIFAKKCPDFFVKENFNYGDMDRSVESVELFKIFAKTMSRADFGSMITWEADSGRVLNSGHVLNGMSALAWALTYNDQELLEIMEQKCPELVEKYRKIYS